MSENQGRRIEGEEGGRRRRWGWLIAGLILLVAIVLFAIYACQATRGGSGQSGSSGSGGSGKQQTTGAQKNQVGKRTQAAKQAGGAKGSARTVASGGKAGGKTGSAGGAKAAQSNGGGAISAQIAGIGQVKGNGTSVTVPAASIKGAKGWLAVQSAGGTVLGYAPLRAGQNSNVLVKLDEPVGSGKLSAVVHADKPADGKFTYPSGDPPVKSAGALVSKPFDYAVSGGTSQSAASQAANARPLPNTGGVADPLLSGGAVTILVGAGLLTWLRRREERA